MAVKIGPPGQFLPRSNFFVTNPLTTDDAFWWHLTLAACYKLAQSILKIGFTLAKKGGIDGWTYTRHGVQMMAALGWM